MYTRHFCVSANEMIAEISRENEKLSEMLGDFAETCAADGRNAIMVKRNNGKKWFVAGISAQKEPLKTKIDLSPFFAKGSTITAYTDDAALNGSAKPMKVGKKPVAVTIPENGGLVFVNE